MSKENKRKLKITIIGIIGMISLIAGISFAAFSATLTGVKNQSISTGCLKVEMTDNGSLSIQNAMPITDEEGLSSTPYVYTIENTCTVDAYYEATLNVMNGSNMSNLPKIKVALDGDSYLKPIKENKLPRATLLNAEANVINTYKLDEGYLRAGEEKTFNLRTWIDYDVESITGGLINKVIIQSEARVNNTLVYNTNTAAYYAGNKQTQLKNVKYNAISTESGIIEQKEGNNTRYFYRGNPNNEIAFGTYNSAVGSHAIGDSILWKVLSTNSDGSINLITKESIGNSTYSNVNSTLTSFYNAHLQDEESYIKTDSTFCKEGATSGEYLAKLRVEGNNPTSKCNGSSTFTKIGLPTVDEVMFAGGLLDTANTTYYLYGGSFLTGTSASSTNVYASNTSKSIYEVSSSTSLGVRPVITLKADTMLSGAGTTTEPYYVTGTYSNPSTDTSDTTKPVIKYARVEEQWSKTNKPVEISATDDTGIAAYIVTNSNTAPSASDTGWEVATSDKYTSINTYDNGTYYAYVKDEAGNISDPEEVKVERVDKVAPTCTIRVNSDPDDTEAKTLTIMSEDANIDLRGYSWQDDENIKTATRKIMANGVYTAYLKDLAGNQGTCNVTVGTIQEKEDEYTLTADANGGTISSTTGWIGTGSVATKILTYTQTYGILPTVTKTGYDFNGWWTEPEEGTQVSATSTLSQNADTSIYAHWIPKTCTLSADANGGSIAETEDWTGTGSTATKSLHYDDEYGVLPEPTRAGYTFDGWYTSASGGTEVNEFTLIDTETCPVQIYAHWTPKQLTVTADAQDGKIDTTSASSWTETVKQDHNLPSEYSEVDYIESTGTEYIDTGYKPTANTGVDVTYQFTETATAQQRVFGVNGIDSTSGTVTYTWYINGGYGLSYGYKSGTGNWVTTGHLADT